VARDPEHKIELARLGQHALEVDAAHEPGMRHQPAPVQHCLELVEHGQP
jgi:hypothetical protein